MYDNFLTVMSNEASYRLKKFIFLNGFFWMSRNHFCHLTEKFSHKTGLFLLKVQEALKNRVHARKRDRLYAGLESLPKNTNEFQQCFCY